MRYLRRSTVSGATVVGLMVTTALVALAPAASAATALNVNSFTDIGATSGACGNTSTAVPATLSLREAVCIANNGGGSYVINLQSGTYDLSSGELDIGTQVGQNVTLNGTGAGTTTIDAQGNSRVLNFDPNLVGGITASVQNLEVTGGADSGFGGAGIIAGGAGVSAGDQLTITDAKIDGNHANGTTPNATNQPGGGVQFIGGVLTITNTLFSNNSAASSPGSAVAYQAQGLGTESFSMTGATVTGNTGTNSFGPSVANGGAVDLAGLAGTSMSISRTAFANNTMTGSAGPARGAALRLQNGTLSVTGSSFTNNSVSGTGSAGGAIEVAGGTATLANNRIVGNSAPFGAGIDRSGGTAAAMDNWWGCNAGPGNSGCDSSSGVVTTNPRLVLSSSFIGPIASTGGATVSADIDHDSVGASLGSVETGLDGVSMAFSSPAPSPATCGPTPVTLSGATAAGSCSFAANGGSGPGQVIAHVDNQSITISFAVTKAPSITLQPATQTVSPGSVTFSAAADGYPVPTVQWQKSTNGGSTFTDIPSATSASLTFTAAAGDNSSQYRAVFTNSVGSATTNAATLTVEQAPSFTSSAAATFLVGASGSFDVTTTGLPSVSAITKTGTLPDGLTFTDNGDGTATVAGTPLAGTGGVSSVDLDASNGVDPDAVQTLTITIDEAPTILTDPSDVTAASGAPVTFTAAASGFPVPTVQWQTSTNGGASFSDIGGATNTTLSLTAAVASDGNEYRAVFTNAVSSATTTPATLTVTQVPGITSATSTVFTATSPGSFLVTSSGHPNATISTTTVLPGWLTLTDNGDGTATLAGTPPTGSGGTVSIALKASNGVVPDATQTFTLTVDESPHISTANNATFTAGSASSFLVSADRGNPTPAFSEAEALPSGLTFVDNGDGTATLSGTPAAGTGGTYTVHITADNGVGSADIQAFTITVHEPRTIASADHTTFAVGSPGAFAVTTGGGYPAATTLSESGALPSGVTFVDNGDGTAALSGTPAPGSDGTFPIVITADNGVGVGTTQSFTLTVTASPTITSSDSTAFVVGTSGTFTVTTSPGYPADTVLTESGSLPSGITFVDNGDGTATLAGSPMAGTGGSYPITLTATNSAGHVDQAFTLDVDQAPQITSANQTTLLAGTAGTFTVTTTGFGVPALSVSPAVPAGLSFVDNGDGTATISGTPSAGTGGSYALSLTAANGVTPDATQSFTLTVNEAPSVTSADHTTFGSGVASTFTVTTGGFPVAAIAESGALPSGVQLHDNGDGTASLSGTPAQGSAGTYPITVTATNGIGSAATQTFTLTVSTAPQTVTFTSTAPTGAVVGSTYSAVATGGGSGNPVVLSIDPGATAFCSLAGSTVNFDHPGLCVVDANQAGNAQYASGSATQSIAVTKAATSTQLTVQPASLTATVAVSTPGAGTPTGTVQFSVDGSPVGSAPVGSGSATLNYAVPAGQTHNVSAVYSGDADFTASSASTVRHDPSITATLSSAHTKTSYGWYRSPVTITFHCSTNGAPLIAPCPSPVTLSHDGAGQSVARTIGAVDGGAATVVVAGINLDTVAPTVSVSGVRNGGSYLGTPPTIRCVGRDSLSGIATCVLTRTTHGLTVVVTATATDRAGNQRSARVSYHLLQFYVLGASYSNGAFNVHRGSRYTVVALTPGSGRPRIYDAAPVPQRPRPADNLMNPAGRQAGLHRFTLSVYFERGMTDYRYWNLGIMVGRTMHVVKIHPY
ncbi:MAG: hypothetical protein JWQ32_3143 [Marmoricola sp.]|nr:hypothetical protein [Marmoricola sp.]